MNDQKYILGCLVVQAIDTYVRVTVRCMGGPSAPDNVRVTRQECPTAAQVASLVSEMRGYWPDNAVLQACGRAAADARANRDEWAVAP